MLKAKNISDGELLEYIKNKNWVTVRDKCPQINVQFKWHTLFFNSNGRTDGRTHGRTNGRSDYINYAPNLIWGIKKTMMYACIHVY